MNTQVLVDSHDTRLPRVAFFARKDIPADTELTWSYGTYYGEGNKQTDRRCYCGSANCRGYLA